MERIYKFPYGLILVVIQLDIKIFKRIEEVLEDYALAQYMKQSKDDERLNIVEARSFYKKLPKK